MSNSGCFLGGVGILLWCAFLRHELAPSPTAPSGGRDFPQCGHDATQGSPALASQRKRPWHTLGKARRIRLPRRRGRGYAPGPRASFHQAKMLKSPTSVLSLEGEIARERRAMGAPLLRDAPLSTLRTPHEKVFRFYLYFWSRVSKRARGTGDMQGVTSRKSASFCELCLYVLRSSA